MPVFLPGKSHEQRNLAGYSPWGRKELDMTEHTHTHNMKKIYDHKFDLEKAENPEIKLPTSVGS